MYFVGFLSSINSLHYICADSIIPVDLPVSDGYKSMTFLDSCDLKKLANQSTLLYGHILDLILSPSDQDTIVDVTISDFISDHALVKCSITFPHQEAHTPNKVQYRRYHCINMSDFSSDYEDTFFVRSPANVVGDLYEQHLHHLADVFDRQVPLVSRLTKKDSTLCIGCLIIFKIQCPKP